ncbi:MAG: YezD family protein [Methylococcaceae bacterium]|jgi:hypothetical protein
MTLDLSSAQSGDERHPVAQSIMAALAGLKFGSVEITVHEGRIVQIERREKQRLNLACPDSVSSLTP